MRATVQCPGAGPLRVHSQWEKLGSSVLPLKSEGFLDPGSRRDRPLGTPEMSGHPTPTHPHLREEHLSSQWIAEKLFAWSSA